MEDTPFLKISIFRHDRQFMFAGVFPDLAI